MRVFRDVIKQQGVELKPVAAELVFDGSRVVFSYESERRPDAAKLQSALRDRLHRRVELRSVGPRECARLCGDVRPLRRRPVLAPLPDARAADHAAHGEGPGPADELGPDHRPLRAASLLPRLRAPALQELPRPRAARGPARRRRRTARALVTGYNVLDDVVHGRARGGRGRPRRAHRRVPRSGGVTRDAGGSRPPARGLPEPAARPRAGDRPARHLRRRAPVHVPGLAPRPRPSRPAATSCSRARASRGSAR